jgi:hypothetical protein
VPDNVVGLKQKRSYRAPAPADISPVESGVPIPPKPSMYPFAEMDVGDSFTMPADRLSTMKTNLSRWRRTNKGTRYRKFIWRAEGDRLRVWRTA